MANLASTVFTLKPSPKQYNIHDFFLLAFKAAPKLFRSMWSIAAHVVTVPSKREELLANFRVSTRGSLRKAPTIMQWVQSLLTLRSCGETDGPGVIRKYNAENPKSSHLVGGKATAVKNLLEHFPVEALELIIQHVQRQSWPGCCFSDDCLSSKRLLPNHNFRFGTAGLWPSLGKITQKSCLLMVHHVINKFLSTPENCRRKANKADMETYAEQAAFVVCLGEKALAECPLDPNLLEEKLHQGFANSEMSLMLEIQGVLSLKDPAFTPRSLQLLAKMRLDCYNRPVVKVSSFHDLTHIFVKCQCRLAALAA